MTFSKMIGEGGVNRKLVDVVDVLCFTVLYLLWILHIYYNKIVPWTKSLIILLLILSSLIASYIALLRQNTTDNLR